MVAEKIVWELEKKTTVGYVDISCFDNEASFFCQKTDRLSKKDLKFCSAITEALNTL